MPPKRDYEMWDSPFSPVKRFRSGISQVSTSPLARAVVSQVARNVVRSVGSQIGSSVMNALSGSFSSAGTQTSRPETAIVRRATSTQRSYLAGKVRPKKRVSRKLRYKKRRGKGKGKSYRTKFGLSVTGVHSCEEHRFVSKTDMVEADRYEAIQVGHTSIPQKAVLLNMCRALIKFSLKKIAHIKEFTSVMTDNSAGYAFVIGDVFKWEFYENWDSNVLQHFTVNVPNATDTFEHAARNLMIEIINYAGAKKLNNIRFKSFTYDPGLTAGRKYMWYTIPLQSLQVELVTKSTLKLQNRTVNIVGVEDDSTDVDNVPVVGYLYNCKGNNFLQKTDRSILKGIDSSSTGGSANTKNNDVILFEGTKKNVPQHFATDAGFDNYLPAESSFSKPAEPPKPYQVVNCKRSSKVRINPGGIKTSILNSRTKTSFSYMLSLLAGNDDGVAVDKQKYSPKLGYCNVLYLEKVIGSKTSPVAVAAEVQFDCWASLTAKGDSQYSNTVQWQQDYGVYP